MKMVKQTFLKRKEKISTIVAKKIEESNLNFEPLKTLRVFDFSPFVLFNIYWFLIKNNFLGSLREFVNIIIIVTLVSVYLFYFSMRYYLIKANKSDISYKNTRSFRYFLNLILFSIFLFLLSITISTVTLLNLFFFNSLWLFTLIFNKIDILDNLRNQKLGIETVFAEEEKFTDSDTTVAESYNITDNTQNLINYLPILAIGLYYSILSRNLSLIDNTLNSVTLTIGSLLVFCFILYYCYLYYVNIKTREQDDSLTKFPFWQVYIFSPVVIGIPFAHIIFNEVFLIRFVKIMELVVFGLIFVILKFNNYKNSLLTYYHFNRISVIPICIIILYYILLYLFPQDVILEFPFFIVSMIIFLIFISFYILEGVYIRFNKNLVLNKNKSLLIYYLSILLYLPIVSTLLIIYLPISPFFREFLINTSFTLAVTVSAFLGMIHSNK
jgi:hypothetical protein